MFNMNLIENFLLGYLYERKRTIEERISKNQTLKLTASNDAIKETAEYDITENIGRLLEVKKIIAMMEK